MEYEQVFLHRGSRGLLRSWVGIFAITLLVLLSVYYLLSFLVKIPDAAVILVLACIVAALLYFNSSQRRSLRALHRGVLRAQEGELEPVVLGRAGNVFLRRLAADYNVLVTNLGSMFREIEECQKRTISERNRNDAILQSLPGALICINGDGRITHFNRRAEMLLATVSAELIGQNLFGVLNLDEEGVALLRDALLYERQVANREISLHLDESTRYFALNLAPFRSPDRREFGAAVVLQDVTDHKRLQESVYTTEKLAAIGQLAAGVAHELNTPLGNIIGYAQLMEENSAEVGNYLRIISSEARRCSRIVENLLSYARRDRCPPETCNIKRLIDEVVETVANCQGRRHEVDISTELESKELLVRGENGQLEIVLVNLLMNAIQAAREGGRPVQVIVRASSRAPGSVVMEVEDNGVGVPIELQSRIFDPFFTTKEVGDGSGLGLAISQMIVTRLGGSLKYDASFKDGARFIVRLMRA